MSTKRYFVRDCCDGEFETYETPELALKAAQIMLEHYRDASSEDAGWPDGFDIEVGEFFVTHSLEMVNKRDDPSETFDYLCEYEFKKADL